MFYVKFRTLQATIFNVRRYYIVIMLFVNFNKSSSLYFPSKICLSFLLVYINHLSISEIFPENRMNHRWFRFSRSSHSWFFPLSSESEQGSWRGAQLVLGSSGIILISTQGGVFTPTSVPGLAAVRFGPIRGQTPGCGGQSEPGFLLTVAALHWRRIGWK